MRFTCHSLLNTHKPLHHLSLGHRRKQIQFVAVIGLWTVIYIQLALLVQDAGELLCRSTFPRSEASWPSLSAEAAELVTASYAFSSGQKWTGQQTKLLVVSKTNGDPLDARRLYQPQCPRRDPFISQKWLFFHKVTLMFLAQCRESKIQSCSFPIQRRLTVKFTAMVNWILSNFKEVHLGLWNIGFLLWAVHLGVFQNANQYAPNMWTAAAN